MKKLLALIATVSCCLAAPHATAYDWLACNTAGKAVAVTLAAGDIGTLPIPGPKSRPSYVAFFTTQSETAILGNLTGKTLAAHFHVDGSPVWWGVGYGPGPASVRLYFTSRTGYYNLNDADRNPTLYWWSNPVAVIMDSTDNSTIDITVSLDPTQWSDANGYSAATCLDGFNAAVAHVAQIGFSFGGSQFFDTGIDANLPTTFHLLSYTAQ